MAFWKAVENMRRALSPPDPSKEMVRHEADGVMIFWDEHQPEGKVKVYGEKLVRAGRHTARETIDAAIALVLNSPDGVLPQPTV
jgi:hypothetical protein